MSRQKNRVRLGDRFLVDVEDDLLKNLTFKVANSKDEIRQAFQILHDGYVTRGVMDPEDHGMRITKYHFLPTTSLLIAKLADEVIATVTLIRDNPMGLPLEDVWSVDFLRDQGFVICEVSALTIKDSYRSGQGKILFPLIKFLSRYAVEFCNVDMFVISVQARSQRFYRNFLNFEMISGDVKEYDFVQGEPSVAQHADIKNWKLVGEAVNEGVCEIKSAFHRTAGFLFNDDLMDNMHFPKRSYTAASDPCLTKYLLKYFTHTASNSFARLPEKDKAMLNALYSSPLFSTEKAEEIVPGLRHQRKELRVYTNLDVQLRGRHKNGAKGESRYRLTNISHSGAELIASEPLAVDSILFLSCMGLDNHPIGLRGRVVSVHGKGKFGVEFVKGQVPARWNDLVDQLTEHYSGYIALTKAA